MTELLLVVPHPDDEAFGAGALLARLHAEGLRTAALTLTRGAAGRTLGLCTREELPDVREGELRGALALLGVDDVTILDHNDHVPDEDRGLPLHEGLAALKREDLTSEVLAVIERVQPRVILTFPPNGMNGHPDHVVCNEVTLQAVERATHKVEALYYYAAEEVRANDIRGESTPRPKGFMPEEQLRALHLPPTHEVLAGDYLPVKLQAIAHHETQALSVLGFMRQMPERLLVEQFHRAFPPVTESGKPQPVTRL